MKKHHLNIFVFLLLLFCFFSFGCSKYKVNKNLFNKLNNDLDMFSQTIESNGYLTMLIDVNANGKFLYQKIRAIKEPMYVEVTQGTDKAIVTGENEDFYLYTKSDDDMYYKQSIDDLSQYDNLFDEDNAEPFIDMNATINLKKCEITYEDYEYVIKCKYKEILNKEMKSFLEKHYQGIKVYYKDFVTPIMDILYESDVKMSFLVNGENCIMTISISVNDKALKYPIYLSVTFNMSSSIFDPISLEEINCKVIPAKNMLDANEIVYVKNYLNFDAIGTSVIKVHLNKGMLVSNESLLLMELYDLKNNKVSQTIDMSSKSYVSRLDKFLPIEKAGTYYLVVKHLEDKVIDAKLTFHKYNTVISPEGTNITELSDLKGEIEGKYDFEKIIFDNDDSSKHLLRVKNTGKMTIVIYYEDNDGSWELIKINSKKYAYLPLQPGQNEMYICHDFISSLKMYKYTYSVSLKEVSFFTHEEIIEDDIPDNFRLSTGKSYYYYTELEKGIYYLDCSDSDGCYITIYDRDGNLLNNVVSGYKSPELTDSLFAITEDGYYYVVLTKRNYDIINYSFYKAYYQTIPDRNNPIILDTSELYTNTLEGLYDYEYYYVENAEGNKYQLTNESEFDLNVIIKSNNDSLNMQTIKPNEVISFEAMLPGVEIVVLQNFDSEFDNPLNYSFIVENIE